MDFAAVIDIAITDNKFSLGSFSFNLTESTFWVILLYGFFINLNNFGMDQNYIQRYHTAKNLKDRLANQYGYVWPCMCRHSLLFFIIGASLYAFYQVIPEMIECG